MYEFFLNIGKWNIQVRSRYPCPEDLYSVRGTYHDPDLVLEIVFPDDVRKGVFKKAQEFTIENGLVHGLAYSERGTNCIRVWSENKCRHVGFSRLESLLARVFYTLSGKEGYRSFLVHASAVARDNLGYVFLGPSGSGKTTVASRSLNEGILLHDEIVILHARDEYLYIQGGPFHTKLPVNTKLLVPLAAMFFLKQGNSLSIQPVKPSNVFVYLLNQIVPPMSFDLNAFQINNVQMDAVWDLNTRLVNTIPGYTLEFSLEDKFWSAIETLRNKDFNDSETPFHRCRIRGKS